MKRGVARAARALQEQGGIVTPVASPLETTELLLTYRRILAPILAAGFSEDMLAEMEKTREADKQAAGDHPDPWNPAFNRLVCTSRYYELAKALAERQRLKDRMVGFFRDYDAILMPVAPVAAFPHDRSEPFFARKLDVDGKAVPYMTMLCWIALATALHLPAVALPTGQNAQGLPVGAQLVGPEHGEDSLFDLAVAAEEVLGGFVPPPV